MSESFSNMPLAKVIPSYLYDQYSDDTDLQAFVDSFNNLAQGYLDWFNSTPLSLYTSPNLYGTLLDWIGQGIYGIERPVISSVYSSIYGAMNTLPMNVSGMNRYLDVQSGTTQIVSDDIYKRVMTWILYRGDGKQPSILWLKKRIARFLFGLNGTDVSLDNLNVVSLVEVNIHPQGAMDTMPMNTMAMNGFVGKKNHEITIRIPANPIGVMFADLFNQGVLPVPFQLKFTVILGSLLNYDFILDQSYLG
ncbi:MAG: hypothetical protein KGI54_15980 [Pseudomonadota bacterium]|nr:hypothetical protein [Pseudomonadota bacterium]